MHIGELARTAEVNIQTIRFYERQGLLPKPARSSAGYRCYAHGDLERVIFIKRNQELGFTLIEIKQLMDLHDVLARMSFPMRQRPGELQGIIEIGRERLRTIQKRINTLNTMRGQLASVLRQLERAPLLSCPASRPSRRTLSKNLKKSS